jgi:hypothetical protein
LLTPTTPVAQALGDNLILKTVAGRDDAERLDTFNTSIHGPVTKSFTRELILHHPNTRPEHWLYIEDNASGRIVCSLALIPWTWQVEGVTLKAGEMGIVGTAEGYRRRGLIRILDRYFKTLLRDGEYDLSHIQGIPYFYRQFGYDYALPLEGGYRLDLHQIPDASESDWRFRLATIEDSPLLARLFDEAAAALSIHAVRDDAIWRYLFEHSPCTDTAREFWLIEDEDGAPVGYWGIELHGFGMGVNVSETSALPQPVVTALLSFLKRLAAERNKPYIQLKLPAETTLVQVARAWGAQDLGTYAWQIHIPDAARLLRTLAPVLERRIAAGSFAGLTQDVVLNFYRHAVVLRFSEGRLIGVEDTPPQDGEEIRIPPPLFAPLALGYRSRDELAQAHHDLSINGQSRYLIDTLFPKMASFIYTIY